MSHTGYGCRCAECEAKDESERNAVHRLRSALAAVTEKLENLPADWHTYATCEDGGSVNADRGCVLCEAHAALKDTDP